MWVQALNNVTARVTQATEEERTWLNDYLSFERVDYSAATKRRIVRVERLVNVFDQSFPLGFVPSVVKAALAEGFKVEVIDTRSPPALFDEAADLAWLRDYQRAAVDAVAEKRRGILWLPTGAGKTEVAVALVRSIPTRWLFLVHRSTLVEQAAERFERRTPGVRAGTVVDGKWDSVDGAPFVCASFQTFWKALQRNDRRAVELADTCGGLLVDEAHTLPAGTFYSTVQRCRGAHYRVGLSGTPLARGDRRSLLAIAALGPVIYRVKTQTLIDRGILAKPTVHFVPCVQECDLPTYQGVYGAAVVRSTVRNRALARAAVKCEKPAFLFVREVAHGKKLVDMLLRHGVRAEFVWGSHSTSYRASLLKRLVAGHFDVLVCSVVFQEGVDVPGLRSVIVGASGQSTIATLQRLGRGIRVDRDASGNVREGGDKFEVWDILDKGNPWLEKHARARMKAYTGEGFETIIEPDDL